MATIYFTSNADSGDGTLRDAMSNASDGDIIAPDPTAFSGLSEVVIALSSGLPLASVSIVGSPSQRIVLDRQGSGYFVRVTTSGQTLAFSYVDFINGYRTSSSESPFYIASANTTVTFDGCRFYNNVGAYSGFLRGVSGATGSTLTFRNCVAWNNTHTNSSYSASVFTYQSAADPTIELTGCTFDTGGEVPFLNPGSYTRTDCLFDGVNDWQVDFDTVGFVDRTANDYRLAPGSTYLSGGSLTGTDILGHTRSGSIGAYDGSWLVARASGSATVSASLTVDYCELASTGALSLAGSDVIVTVTKEASLASGASVSSTVRGYLVVPSGTSSTGVTLSNVVITSSGADALTFSATTTTLTWTATDSTKPVVLEYQSSGAWVTIAETTGTSYTYSLPAGTSVRLFDGVDFLTATVTPAPTPPTPGALDFHSWGVYDATITVEASVPYYTVIETARAYETTTEYILMSVYYNRGESPLLFARITDSATGAIIDPTSVSGITYTCYKLSSGWGIESRTPVTGHQNVTVPTTAILSALVTNDSRWTIDTTGYNFIFEPDSRTAPIFPDAGEYVVVVTISFSSANPIPLSYNVSVN